MQALPYFDRLDYVSMMCNEQVCSQKHQARKSQIGRGYELILSVGRNVADPGSVAFLSPESVIRIRDEIFPDLGSRIFLTMTKTLLLIKS
jgi:hypothetical protein